MNIYGYGVLKMRNIYLLALLAAIVMSSSALASAQFDVPGGAPKVPAGQRWSSTPGAPDASAVQKMQADERRYQAGGALAFLNMLESKHNLEKHRSENVGVVEILEGMTGANVLKDQVSTMARDLPTDPQTRMQVALLNKALSDRHDIYKGLYDIYLNPKKSMPAVSFEEQLRSNMNNIELIQSTLLSQVSKQPGVKVEKLRSMKDSFKAMNQSLDLQYDNLLMAVR